jgi:putative peptidoglycan lipid II flippase
MSLARNVATVGGATVLSRLLGFIRDVGVAALLGAGALSDAYLAALQVPNLFRRLLSEGALNSAFVPMWLRKRQQAGPEGARRFGAEVLGVMLVILGAIAILCVVFAPVLVRLLAPGFEIGSERHALTVAYIRLTILYVVIAGIVAVWAAVLNAEGRVGAVAFGVVIFNCVFVAVVIVLVLSGAAATERTGAILSGAVALSGIGQLALIGAALFALPAAPRMPRFVLSADAWRFFALALPGIIAAGVPQLKLMAGAVIASSSNNAVSWLYYANRLYELPLGIVSIAVASVLVPLIAASVRDGKPEAFAAAQSRGFEIALGLALPAAIGLVVLAEPIVRVLFERGAFGPRDTVAVAAALAAISAGLPGHALEKVLGAVSFAHEDTRTPMLAALAGLTTAIVAALLLFPLYGHVGIAAAIATSGWVGAFILAILLGRRGWLDIDAQARRKLIRIVLGAIVMGIAIFLAEHALAAPLGRMASTLARIAMLGVLVGGGLAVYLGLLHLFGVMRLRELALAIRKGI